MKSYSCHRVRSMFSLYDWRHVRDCVSLYYEFVQILTPGDVFAWMNKTVIPKLFPQQGFAGEPLYWPETQYINGLGMLRFGPVRLRQLRTNKGTATVRLI